MAQVALFLDPEYSEAFQFNASWIYLNVLSERKYDLFSHLNLILNRLYNSLSIDTMVSQIVRLVRVTPSPLVCNNCVLALCNAVEINAESIETILNGNFVNSVLDLDFVSSLFFFLTFRKKKIH